MNGNSATSSSTRVGSANVWRQLLNLVFATTQLIAIFWVTTTRAGLDSGSRVGFESPVFPAAYTFAIWLLIYPGALLYAVYQALPTQRRNPLLIHTGWWTAAAFGALTLWPIFQALGWLGLTVVCIFVMFAALFGAFITWMTYQPRTRADRYLAVLPISIFFGYITAATVLTIALIVPRIGGGGIIGSTETLWAVSVLLAAGIFAAFLTWRSGGNLGYALTVVWSLVGIVVQNVVNSPNGVVAITAGGVALCTVFALVAGRRTRKGMQTV